MTQLYITSFHDSWLRQSFSIYGNQFMLTWARGCFHRESDYSSLVAIVTQDSANFYHAIIHTISFSLIFTPSMHACLHAWLASYPGPCVKAWVRGYVHDMAYRVQKQLILMLTRKEMRKWVCWCTLQCRMQWVLKNVN